MKSTFSDLAARYSTLKADIETTTGASEDLLHVHAGLLIFVVAALVLRRKMRSWVPLAIVALFALSNEVLDWLSIKETGVWTSLLDVVNTVFWPAILFLLARRWR